MYRLGLLLIVLVVALTSLSCASSAPMRANAGKLHLAAQSGDLPGIDAALKAGDDVNQADDYGMTPLLYAAASPNVSVVKYLLEKGADPNHMAHDGETALLVAARKSNRAAAEVLIQRGSKIDYLGEDGKTALAIATANKNQELFDMLLKRGARPDITLTNCDTALIKSIRHDDKYFFDRILSAGADPNHTGRAGNTPLIVAVFSNKVEHVNELLSAGAKINSFNDTGCSALFFAAGVRGIDPGIIDRLVEKGADVNLKARNGLTPLKIACRTGNTALAIYLYEKGANPNFNDTSDEDIELNGVMQHILGDYFLAKDKCGRARAYYEKAQACYKKSADKYNGDVSKIMWKQIAVTALLAMSEAAQEYATQSQAEMQSRQMAQIAGMGYALKTHTGPQGYYSYMAHYNKTYVPTFKAAPMAYQRPPQGDAGLNAVKEYARNRAKYFEDQSVLLGKILVCFDKNPGGGVPLRSCVETETGAPK
jgi:ankyrin repeat protein